MRAGFARVDITPPVGTELTGFIARDGPSTGVHDPLYARALVFEDGGVRASIVTADLLGFGLAMTRRVRETVASSVGIPPNHQLFAATHTHGGPETGPVSTIARPDLGYLRHLERSLVEAVERASDLLEPTTIGYGESLSAMGQNRIVARDGDEGAYDPLVSALRVSDLSGKPLASVVNYACHATAAGPTRLINADYPGRLAVVLEATGCGPIAFVNGAGADVNPRAIDGRGFDQVERAGDVLASDALRAWREARPGEWSGLLGMVAPVTLPLAPLPSPDEAERLQVESRRLAAEASTGSVDARAIAITHSGYAEQLARIHFGRLVGSPEVVSEVQVLRVGPVVFVALPGETFSSTGLAIRAASRRPVIIAGWANDLVGYLCDESAHERGGYEFETAHRYYGLPARFSTAARDNVLVLAQALLDSVERDPTST